ncbi:MAG: hypothetical protein JNK81_07750 [Anaerolineales bacterium]|nr:hypothetical protein [Anaerolineales bacterium]
MKHKNFVIQISVLLLLVVASIGGYSLGKSAPQVDNSYQNYLPPLIELDLPPQTVNGITADLESYYADGLRLVFVVRLTGENNSYYWDSVSLTDNLNQFVNASYGLGPVGNSLSLFSIDMAFETPLQVEQFKGVLSFSVVPMMPEFEISGLSSFEFDIDLPIKSALILNPNQKIAVNGVEMLLEKLLISPAYTKVYLCYNKPTNADWGIGGDVELTVDSQKGYLSTYSLLYDTDNGDVGKNIEPDWSPPIEEGRCIKLGFPIGNESPQSITLRIPTLNQSMPEAIPEDELAVAREKLLQQGIDMDWQVFDYGNGGGGSGPVYNKLPAGMTEEKAYQKFIEALGYIHHGPWEFTINP